MNRLTIVTLGTGGEAFLTRGVERALHEAPRVVLRTARHPMADFLKEEGIAFETLDALYDECEDFDTFNRAAAVKVLSLLNESPVCYAVSDAAFDETVAQIQRLKPREADVRVLPGVSHADRCLALVADAPAGVRLYAAESFLQTRVSPEEPLLVTELHSRECAGSVKLRLMDLLPEDLPVSFFTGDETTGELALHSVPLYELDRQSAYDHLTAAYVPAVPMERRTRYDMDDLVHVMQRLRAPDGCPWDREQTHSSIRRNFLEETYEVLDAIDHDDASGMCEELGDVLMQVAFHAQIEAERGRFTMANVVDGVARKLVYRHPHVFGDVQADTSQQVLANWDVLKRREKGQRSTADAVEAVPHTLPALWRAEKIQSKTAKAGF